MNLSDCTLKIGEASFRWEDESPLRKRNRLAQREYRKRKRRAARPGPKELDCKTESPSPTRTILHNCDTEVGISSIMQPAMPVGNFRFCLNGSDQVTPVEGSNARHICDNTVKPGSAYQREEAPVCFPNPNGPGFSHVLSLYGGRLGAEHIDFETREYVWPNEQGLPISTTETCVVPQASAGSLIAAVNPSIAYTSHIPACVATGIVDLMDNVMGGLHDGGMSHEPFHHATATAANPEDRFGMILETCEAAEIPSVDPLAMEYYTVSHPATSHWAAAQSRSRSPNLPETPDNIYVAPSPWDRQKEDPWSFNESKRFREKVLRFVENGFTSGEGQLGMAQWDQSASVGTVFVEQRNGGIGSDGN